MPRRNYHLPERDDPAFDRAAARALLEAARVNETQLAERATGYVLGGISPLGQRSRLRTVVDESAARWGRMLCSAGRRGLEIELTPADLIRLTGAVVAPITAGRHSRGI